ncbi:MAG: hypothetical protein ACE5IY_09700 [bacterium]
MLDLPFETTLVIAVAAVSLILSVLTLLILLLNRIRRTFMPGPAGHISIPQHVLRFLATFLWITTSLAVLFIAAFVQSFQSFTKRELVAEVQCRPLADEPNAMLLELTQVSGGERLEKQGFILKGDQWALEGDILKWDDWLNFAGLHTMYKLTRVRGRYVHVTDELNEANSIFSLVDQEDDPRWRWLYKYGYRLRFVDAVYGNTVYTYPSEDSVYEVFVTTSGYIVKVKEGITRQ